MNGVAEISDAGVSHTSVAIEARIGGVRAAYSLGIEPAVPRSREEDPFSHRDRTLPMRSQIKIVSFCLAVLLQLTGLPPQSVAETASPSFSSVDKSWVIMSTPHRFPDLIRRLEEAVKVNEMNIVNVASASEGAKAQGYSIPGNRVVGVFRNDFARRMLAASIPAGIEAPIRIYLVEGANGQTTLAYRRPTQVFAPYLGAPGGDLEKLAGDLDVIFEKIASATVSP